MKTAFAVVVAFVVIGSAAAADLAVAKPSQQERVILHTGTLIIVIPTANGAVVAADSRGNGSDGSIDDTEQKIVHSNSLPVAAFATGTTSVYLPIENQNGRAQVDYNVYAILQRELDELNHVPDKSDFRRIVVACGQIVLHSHAAETGQLKEHYVQIGMVTFNPSTAKTAVYVARLHMDANNYLSADLDPISESDSGSVGTMGVYGEGEYLQTQILRGSGRSLLSQDAIRFLDVKSTVGKLTSTAAYSIARNMIQAVSQSMADNHVARVTVGGPTKGVLVGPSGVQIITDNASGF